MANRVLQAQMEGDLRYQEFMEKFSERTGKSISECEHMTMLYAMGVML